MRTALAFMQRSLEFLVRVAGEHDNTNYDDDGTDADVELAVELALEHIRRLRAAGPMEREAFAQHWNMAAAAIRLGTLAYGRTDSTYYRMLSFVQQQFEVSAAMVEFVDEAQD
ncbi:hypothetical protein JC796_06495 [Delftia acidovorans]|uniref:hypothetical protein n=1 Tax=Delftia acidovorans TaxID=80866 RepID=UPI0018E74412|nr:hypothetical protein [Delftia acidovorans]MBJ2140370.1 hypothetical protein [Delftia acidovorans]